MSKNGYDTLKEAIGVALDAASADGERRIVIQWLKSSGGNERFYVEPWNLADSLFYERSGNVTVVNPRAAFDRAQAEDAAYMLHDDEARPSEA